MSDYLLYLCRTATGESATVKDIKRRVGKLEEIAGTDDRPLIVFFWDTREGLENHRDDPSVIVVTWDDGLPEKA